jgi:hypothetical protein
MVRFLDYFDEFCGVEKLSKLPDGESFKSHSEMGTGDDTVTVL